MCCCNVFEFVCKYFPDLFDMVLMVEISKSLPLSPSGKTPILKDQALIRIGLLGQNSTFFVIRSLENQFQC